jgi:aspartyl-tRNA(Asn)/glutamyl-tRNA(Gln) amidotransferase subunit A
MTVRSAVDIAADVREGRIRAAEVCARSLDAIDQRAAPCNAFITVAREYAAARAAEVDGGDSRSGPLAGVPVAIKDNICTRGIPTTAASRLLASHVPLYSATVIERLEAAGAVVVGKTNCDEFAMGSSSEHSPFGAVRNPWDRSRIAGGSSGGSAVAVATGCVPIALGSETGGSVRQPAALCGIVGVKPTYGRVSRYGLIAFVSSIDQVGVFGATVGDAALGLSIVAGRDARDATSAAIGVDDYPSAARAGLPAGLRVGVPRALLTDGLEPGVRTAFDDALRVMREAGAEIVDVELPHSRYATATYAIVVTAEASSNLSRYDGVRYGARADSDTLESVYAKTRALFGNEVKRRIMLGTYVLSAGYYDAYYVKAQRVRRLIALDFDRGFAHADVIATPTSPTTAFALGERLEDPVQMYLADVFTASANLAGIPAISVPCGVSNRLPVGLQLMAPAWKESVLFRVAAGYEGLTQWSRERPPGGALDAD